jgi:hypothetical protein
LERDPGEFRSTRDEYHKTCLRNGSLWISGAMDLNDPFDSKPKALLHRGNFAERQARDAVRKIGVLSFPGPLRGDDKEMLQWAHYADGHRGYCLLIRDPALWKETKAVTYPPSYPDFSEQTAPTPDFGEKVGFFKAPCWEYENERRALLPGEGKTEHAVPKSAIWAIIFGCWSRCEEREEVASFGKHDAPNCYFFHSQFSLESSGCTTPARPLNTVTSPRRLPEVSRASPP